MTAPAPPRSRGQGKCLNAFATTTLCQFISTTSRVWMDSRESSAISTTWLLEFNYLSDFTPSDGSHMHHTKTASISCVLSWRQHANPTIYTWRFARIDLKPTESLVLWPHQTSPKVCQYGFDRAMSFFFSTDQLPPESNQTWQHFLLPSALWTQSWSNIVSVMDYPWSALNSRNRTTLGVTLSLSMWALKYSVDKSACVGMLVGVLS